MLYVLQPPPPPFPPSRSSDEELELQISGYLRRKSIIERKMMDAPPPLVIMRLVDGQPAPAHLEHLYMDVDIMDVLGKCFFCRADGWLGHGQVQESGTRICLNCFEVMAAMGYVDPSGSRAKVTIADPRVPKRPRPGRSRKP